MSSIENDPTATDQPHAVDLLRPRIRRLTPIAALLLIVAAALLLRLLWLDADAAATLTWSGAPFTDEGLYSHTARNKVLFGVWRTDEWDNRLVSPLFDLLAFGMYTLFGVGYVQLRLISVLGATIALPFFCDFARTDLGSRWALLATTLWAADYFWFQYSRLGLLEPSMVLWLVVAAWCWRRALGGGLGWAIGSGAAAAIAWIWKSLAIVFVPVPLLALILLGLRSTTQHRSWRIAAGYLLGLTLVLAVYAGGWYLPQRSEIAHYNAFYAADRVPGSPAEAARVIWNNLRARELWSQTPLLLIAALVGAVRAAWRCWRGTLPPVAALWLAWLGCGAALLALPYSPSRYYTLLLPALVGLAVFGLAPRSGRRERSPTRWFPIGLLALCLAWNSWWYAHWALHRRTTLIDSSRTLHQLVPPDEMIVGVTACGLSLANQLPCAPPFAGLANDDRPLEQLGARYVLVEDGSRDDFVRRFYGPLLARATPIRRLALGPRWVTLYRVAPLEE